jgi:hypothetical protein
MGKTARSMNGRFSPAFFACSSVSLTNVEIRTVVDLRLRRDPLMA